MQLVQKSFWNQTYNEKLMCEYVELEKKIKVSVMKNLKKTYAIRR